MIQGFDKAVNGMEVGQSKTVTILAAEAYGPYQEEMVLEVNRDQLPAGMSPEVGEQLQMRNAYGGTAIVTVIETSDTSIKVDANHPLAGKDLIFELELVQVNP
jgi:peptidylprolyl isomerase